MSIQSMIGKRVKVKHQDIRGEVVEEWGKKVVIEDEDSEYEWPENRLEYRLDEVEVCEEKQA